MEGILVLRSGIEGTRRAVRSAADAINGALLGTEEEALMNRDPIMEVVAQNPREALRFIKLVMLFGASTGVFVSVPCIVYLSLYWGNCKCNKPLQWWVLIFSLLQVSQVPVRYLFFFHLHTTPDDRTRIINTARILTGGRGWKCSKFVSILSYAWFILGVVWVFNAYDCSEAPGLWKLTVAAIVVSMLRLVTTFVCFWMSFPPNAGIGQQPDAFRGAATAEQIARLPLYTYAEKKKYLTALYRKRDAVSVGGEEGSGGVAIAGGECPPAEVTLRGASGSPKNESLLRTQPFSELSMPSPERHASGAARTTRTASNNAVDLKDKKRSELSCLLPLTTITNIIAGCAHNIGSDKDDQGTYRRYAASKEMGKMKEEYDRKAFAIDKRNTVRRRTRSVCSSRVAHSTFGLIALAAASESSSSRTSSKRQRPGRCSSVDLPRKQEEERFSMRRASRQGRTGIVICTSPEFSATQGVMQLIHSGDDRELNSFSGPKPRPCVSVFPPFPEPELGSDAVRTPSVEIDEEARFPSGRNGKISEITGKADATVAPVERKSKCEVSASYTPAAPATADASPRVDQCATEGQQGGRGMSRELSSVQENCCICLSEFQDAEIVRELHCTHFFHQPCIDRWLMKNKQCPLCLRNIDADQVEPGRPEPHTPRQSL